jgi:CBS domain-containing protein
VKVKDVMSESVTCCSPDARLPEVARAMVECDCGEIPVVDDKERMRPIGVVTDRDIVVRAVAAEQDARELRASECMTSPCITTTPEASIDEVFELMQQHKIRRVPVVDESGSCCGIVAQADIARRASKKDTGKVVNEVSKPSATL